MAATLAETGVDEELAFAVANATARQGNPEVATPAKHGLVPAVHATFARHALRHRTDAQLGGDPFECFGERRGGCGCCSPPFDGLQAGGHRRLTLGDALVVEGCAQRTVLGFQPGDALGKLPDHCAQIAVVGRHRRRSADQQGERRGARKQGPAHQ